MVNCFPQWLKQENEWRVSTGLSDFQRLLLRGTCIHYRVIKIVQPRHFQIMAVSPPWNSQ